MKKILAVVLAAVMCLAVFAGCANTQEPDGTVTYNIENAVAFVKNMYKTYLTENETAADFRLTTQIIVDKATFTVAWSTNTDKVTVELDEENKEAIINVDEKSPEAVEYELKATVTAPDGTSGELTFRLIVPKYSVLGYDEYYATEAGKAVVVGGVVVAVHSVKEGNKYNQLYVQDENGKGGYYVYSMTQDPQDLGIKMGMTVSVTGTKDIYSGTHEIKDATVVITDSTVKDITPLDITEAFKNAESLKDEALTSKLGMLVTVKGVEITGQDTTQNAMYFKFKLDGLESYIRVYATDCPASVTDEQMTTIMDEHGKHTGWKANVTGVVVMYGGAIYLNPVSVDAFEYLSEIERTPAEKLDVEAEKISIDAAVNFDTTIDLPLKGSMYDDIVISWTSDNTCAVVDAENGKLTVSLQKEAQVVTLTATLSLGDATKTVTFTVNVAAMPTVVPSVVTEPKADTAYKFYLTQKSLGKLYYINGEMSGFYMATTENSNEAINVYAEIVDGGFKLYVKSSVDGTKTYISIVEATGSDGKSHINAIFSTENGCVFTMNTQYNTPVTTIGSDTYYLGTYGTNSTFGASKISYASTSFVGQLATMIDTSSVSDTDKVAAEKDALTISKDEFNMDGSIDLALKGTTYGDVQITWTSSDACAVIDSTTGKLTVTLQKEAKTVTLTATIKCGDTVDTRTFEISVDKKSTLSITVQDKPTADTAYKFYVSQGKLNQNLFINGKMNGYYGATVTTVCDGVDVYLETTDGGYNLYFNEGASKKYVNCTANGSYVNITFGSSATTVYTFDTEIKTLIATVNGNTYFFGSNSDHNTVSPYATSNITANDYFVAHLVTYTCTHSYSGDCDTVCNECGASRDVTAEHTYTNNCDTECDVCGYTRQITHTDSNNDGICDVCNNIASVALFEFGANDSTKTDESNQDGSMASGTYTSGNYTLVLTGMNKVYDGSYDAKGNSCLKLGTSQEGGSFTFTVDDTIKSVVIKVAGYKGNKAKINVNGTDHEITKYSQDGEYVEITIDTSTTKTVEFKTSSGGYRCKIDSIAFFK